MEEEVVAAGSRQCHIDASLNCRPIPATPKMALGLILLAELVAAIHQEIKVSGDMRLNPKF